MRKLNEVLIRSGVEVYREIIPVSLYSLVSSAILVPLVLFLPAPFALALFPLLYMPLVYGVLYAYHQKQEGKRTGLRSVFAGAAQGFVPALVFGFLCSLLILILWSTWWYYGGKDGLMNLSFAVFQTYFVVMAFVSQFYTLQLVLQQKLGIGKAMAESVKLFFRYPGYTLGAFIQALCVSVLLLLTIVGFAALFNGIMAIYQHKVAYNVLHPDEGKDGGTA